MAEPPRVLIAGWPNSPHVVAWAEAVASAGYDVHIAGRDAPQLPASAPSPNVHTVHTNGAPLVRSLRLSRALAKIAAELSPDLVHAHWLPESGWMAAREGLQPLVCSAWGSDVLGVRGLGRRRSPSGARTREACIRRLRAPGARNPRTRGRAGRGCSLGTRPRAFSPGDTAVARQALRLDHDGPLIVSVRGLDPVYNPELLLEAFALVRDRQPKARLLLKNPATRVPSETKAAIERLGLRDAVMMLGNVPVERMPDVFRAADVVVSIPSSDSSPRSVWEALACGKPVVVSDLPWAREELEHGRHALFTPLEVPDVADAIEAALGNHRLGEEGRLLAQRELEPAACTARIDALYRSVLERR